MSGTKKEAREAELARLEAQFEESAGRGVELAERVDQLRREVEKRARTHTPTPWYANDEGLIIADDGSELIVAHIEAIGPPKNDDGRRAEWDAIEEANAAFIVRACNAHGDLLEAAKDVLGDLARYVSTHGPGPDRRLDVLRAAIAKGSS